MGTLPNLAYLKEASLKAQLLDFHLFCSLLGKNFNQAVQGGERSYYMNDSLPVDSTKLSIDVFSVFLVKHHYPGSEKVQTNEETVLVQFC